MLSLQLLLLTSFSGFILCGSISSGAGDSVIIGSSSSSSSGGGGLGGGGGGESSNPSVDHNLKNLRIIESKYIPDISVLSDNILQQSNTENWQQVRHFMENGLPVLGLYGYKVQRGKHPAIITQHWR